MHNDIELNDPLGLRKLLLRYEYAPKVFDWLLLDSSDIPNGQDVGTSRCRSSVISKVLACDKWSGTSPREIAKNFRRYQYTVEGWTKKEYQLILQSINYRVWLPSDIPTIYDSALFTVAKLFIVSLYKGRHVLWLCYVATSQAVVFLGIESVWLL